MMVYCLHRYMVQGIGGQEINLPEIRYYDMGAEEQKSVTVDYDSLIGIHMSLQPYVHMILIGMMISQGNLEKIQYIDADYNLITPLGKWTDGNCERWQWFYHPPSHSVYSRSQKNTRWKKYKKNIHQGTIGSNTLLFFNNHALYIPLDVQKGNSSPSL